MSTYDVTSGETVSGIELTDSDHMNVHRGGVAVSITLRNLSDLGSHSW